jgi:hypothetical protein
MANPPFKYSLSSLLPFVRQSLSGTAAYNKIDFGNFVNRLWTVLSRAGVPGVHGKPPTRGYDLAAFDFDKSPQEMRYAAIEAFNYLQSAGYIMEIPEGSIPGLFFNMNTATRLTGFYVTERGAMWASGAEPVPEDSEVYMNHLRKRVPNLDPVMKEYVAEGLSAFVRGNYFSAAVMVGAAAEKAIYLLAASLKPALSDATKQGRLQNLTETERSLKKLFDFVVSEIKSGISRKIIPYTVHEGAEAHLGSLIEAVRVQRNDAVHPQNAKVTPDSVSLSYQAFPAAVDKIEKLRDWCDSNSAAL